MKSKIVIAVYVIIYITTILLPLLHSDTYGVINNDTMAHLEAFEKMEVQGYKGAYGGQVIVGWLINHSGIEPQIAFMIFNFAMLAVAGLLNGIMVYMISGSKIASMIAMPLTTLGTVSVMHLFYSGTIFNIVAIMVIIPALVIIWYCIYRRYGKWWAIGILPLVLSVLWFHPALGIGVFRSGEIQEAVLNIRESLSVYIGIYNIIILFMSLAVIVIRGSINRYALAVVSILSAVVIISGIIGYNGLTEFPSRVIINMCLFISIITVILLGSAISSSTNHIKYGLIAVSAICVIPGTYQWIMNSVVKGLPANVILS